MSLKNKILLASGAVLAGMTATPAFAEGNYFGGFVGAALVDDNDLADGVLDLSFDTGLMVGGVIGTHLSDNIRIEGELSYLSADGDCEGKCSGSFDSSALELLGNAWYDFATDSGFRPYVGGGVGIAKVSFELDGIEADETGLAWQVGAGVRLGETGAFDIGYRYRAISIDVDDVDDEFEANAHVIQVGWTGQF